MTPRPPSERPLLVSRDSLRKIVQEAGNDPVVASPGMIATAGSLFYLLGAAVAVIVALTGGDAHTNRLVEWGSAGSAFCAGVLLARFGPALPHWFFSVMNATGSMMITVVVIAAGPGGGADTIAILFMTIPIGSYFFNSLRTATVHHGLGVAALLVLGATGRIPWAEAVTLVLLSSVTAVVVAWLVRAAASAETDPLTGLLNRTGFDRAVRTAMASAGPSDPLSVAYLDIDRFEAVNTEYGSQYGDGLLRATAESFRRASPPGVLMGRTTGDGFAFCFPGTAAEAAAAHLERLRITSREEVTYSGGVADSVGDESVSVLISRARAALLTAKQSGRDRIVVSAADHAAVAELADAIDSGQLRVFYQPIVDLSDGHVLGAEALVRWQHPARGIVGPDQFIPLAESGGLINRLGAWVLSQAVETASAWTPPLKVTVNASGHQLAEPGFAGLVLHALSPSGLAPERLVIEVTESTLDAESTPALANLAALRSAGVRIALDDFGTGYSSLSRLDRLPIDIVKLDRSFVSRITDEHEDAPVVAAAVAMSHALGLTMVAEGIEEPLQAEVLARYGCEQGQGFHYGRPSPVSGGTDPVPDGAARAAMERTVPKG
jgi:diguanylate cyclase (GGDEF)-like protein